MNGEGYCIQIALEVKASFLDEALVFRIVRDRIVRSREEKLSAVRLASPSQVGVHKGVRAGQQPRWFRGSVFSQLDGESHRRSYNHERQSEGESASNSHEMRSAIK